MYVFLKKTWNGAVYSLSLRDDAFIHFTPQSRAREILASGRLLFNPPYKKFGIDSVTAISTSFGSAVAGVQTTHIKETPDDPIVALWFKTNTLPPKINYPEEVYWSSDVVFTKVKLLTKREGLSILSRSKPPTKDDFSVVYEGSPSHKQLRTAKYKNKKTVKNQDGKDMIVYEYSDQQINKRHKEKSQKVEKIRQNINSLETQVLKDLKKEDTRQVALAVALINHTYERVGNDDSASNGHYGVTGWKKKHLSFKGSKAFLSYTGKSGVRHNKEVDDKVLVSALREISKGLKDDDVLLSDIKAPDVNEYLNQYGITAKDMRGYHANREMQERLKALREERGELPKDKKEKDKILKEEFKEALNGAAKAVGHEEATLRGQYLVPHLEDTFMKDGTVITTLKKAHISRIATRVFGTKTENEKMDEEADRLVKKQPKSKPPRKDRQRRRIDIGDKDTTEDKDLNSKDMSMNYKVIGGSLGGVITRVASRYMLLSRLSERYLSATTEIVETPNQKDTDKKEKEDKKKELVRKKETEAWDKFTGEKIKDPESKREVSWGTFQKKHPKDAQKIRNKFRTDFEESFKEDQVNKENEQAQKLDRRLTEEELAEVDNMVEEVVNLNGREIRLPFDTDDRVRSVSMALEEPKRDDETVEDYNSRKAEEISKSIRGMDTKALQQLWDSGMIDKSDPRVNDAIDTMMSMDAMGDVVGRPLSESEAKAIEDFYSAMLTETIKVEHFGSDKEEGKSFIADFVEGAKNSAVEALKESEDADLGAVMKDYLSNATTNKEKKTLKIHHITKEFMSKEQKEALKSLEESQKKVESIRKEKQTQMDQLSEIDKTLSTEDISDEDREQLETDKASLQKSVDSQEGLLKSEMENQQSLTEKTQPSSENLQKALDKMIQKLPKEIQKEYKDFGNTEEMIEKVFELTQAEALKKYEEIIENSSMPPEEKKKALERAKDPNFDPEGALAGMMSESDDIENEI